MEVRDFKNGEVDKTVIVPSHEDGVLMVDIPHLGRRAVDEIDLTSIKRGEAVVVDDTSRRLGLYGIINCIAYARIPVPHSSNSVGYRVEEFQELVPPPRE